AHANVRYSGIAFLLTLILTPAFAAGDDTLVIELPKIDQGPVATETIITKTVASAPKTNPAANVGTSPSRHGRPQRSSGELVVGRLAVASNSSAIRRSRSSSSRKLASVSAGTYMALTNEAGEWYGILMANGSTGWMPKRDVKIL